MGGRDLSRQQGLPTAINAESEQKWRFGFINLAVFHRARLIAGKLSCQIAWKLVL
jgi:hypothetical protein